jgi:hypothetical protein
MYESKKERFLRLSDNVQAALVSPDVMQAAVSADGRTVCVSIRRLKLLVQPLDRIGGSSDVAIPPREFPPHFQAAPVRCHATS